MKRLSVCMLFGCVFALGLGVLSCEAAEQETRTLTDANGREVELNEDIQKAIVSNRYNLEKRLILLPIQMKLSDRDSIRMKWLKN